MAVNILGNMESYDPNTKRLTFQCAFITESMEEDIEKLLHKSSMHKFSFSSIKEAGTYGQQKRFFGSIGAILDKILKRKHTAKEMSIWYEVMARKYFGISRYTLGEEDFILPRLHLSELTKEDRDRVTEQIQEDFSHLGIDFISMGL